MNLTKELELAEQAVDALLAESTEVGPGLLAAYAVECGLGEREALAWRWEQRRLVSRRERRVVRPWQLPLVYAWQALPVRAPRRSQHTGQCFCKNGHEFTPENTYVRPDGTGRQCRLCNTERTRRRRACRKHAK